jgi:hypothetical protein
MGVVENMKEMADLIKKLGDIELNRKVLTLETEVLDLTREKRRAEEKVEELERTLRFKGDLKFKEPFYWLGDDQTPYCPVCWEDKHKALHVHYSHANNHGQYWACPNCKADFTSHGIPCRH